MERISANPYPGRGIVLGRTPKGQLVQVYWIMGRSANSRNRVFAAKGGEVRTEPADPSKVEDPSLIIYTAMAETRGEEDCKYVATNGDQTTTVMEALADERTFEDALRTRHHEPDAPNFTPRISGCFVVSRSSCLAKVSVIRRSPLDTSGKFSDRHFHEFDFNSPAFLGQGCVVTTYMGDGNPLPSFEGSPFFVPVISENGDEIAETFWSALNEDNKVSLAVKVIDPTTGRSSVTVRNKYSTVAQPGWCMVTSSESVQVELPAVGESGLKDKIRQHLKMTLPECFIPELGDSKSGKVRDIYFSGENVLMVTNDRVSAFDFVLPNLIPFKGQVLNQISEFTMEMTKDVLPNALISNVDENVVVQKKMRNLNVEWIVRGYLWGSLAAAYERGDRMMCGLSLPDGLIRYQKFDEPLFTPTTKAEVGHDENMSMEEVEKLVGKDLAHEAKQAAMRLFKRGQEVMRKRGLILIDTKYEFGVDETGKLHVIDEVNTPDSSRLCGICEWEAKYAQVTAEMATGKYSAVTELLRNKPELKVQEFSKQYVRDALLEMGFDPAKDKEAPRLSEEQVVECSYRYIRVFERITERTFKFPSTCLTPSKRILAKLSEAGLLVGCVVVIIAGSTAEKEHADLIRNELRRFSIPCLTHVCSAHREPTRLVNLVQQYNKSIQPVLIVTCARGTDALSGLASYFSQNPVVACPPDGINSTCLTNPAGSSNAFLVEPSNVAKYAAQIFANSCPVVKAALEASITAEDGCR